MERMVDLKACAAGNKLSNYGFSTSPRRDNSMYNISDLSNIDHQKYVNRKNSIDKYLELNNILPHANTLALGYKQSSMYDKIVTGTLKKDPKGPYFGKRRGTEMIQSNNTINDNGEKYLSPDKINMIERPTSEIPDKINRLLREGSGHKDYAGSDDGRYQEFSNSNQD